MPRSGRSDKGSFANTPGFALALFVLWLLATAGVWFFAFASLPPTWELARRVQVICFGRTPQGLPELYGWLQLVGSPAIFLVMLLLGWREELKEGFRRILHLWTGRIAVGLVLILAGIGLYLVGMRIAYAKREIPPGVPDALPEDYPVVSLALPDLEYQVIEGEKRNLKELEGPAILSFFYAHCATVCPVTISGVLSAQKELLATGREVRTVLLLTLDPHRDTLERLKEYRRRWEKEDDPHLLWGRADPQTLEDALRRLNYSFERDPRSGEIAHPPFVYLIGREGRVRMILSQPIPRWIREGMERILMRSP